MDKKIKKKLRALFRRKRVLNLEKIVEVVGQRSTRTAFRYLKQLDYISSYTHTRSYYTLKEIVTFNQEGFWHFGEIGFSVYGSLKDILVHLINTSDSGHTHSELEQLQKCRAHNTLKDLVKDEKLQRKNVAKNSTRVGLENLKKRYWILVEKELEVITENGNFIVKIPLIEKPHHESNNH